MNPIYKTFQTLGGCYVYDRGTNSIIHISENEFVLLNNRDEETILNFRKKGFLEDNKIKTIKHPNTDNLEYYINNNIEKLTIQLTQNCNLNCSYCPYTGGYDNRSHSDKTISMETIKKGIDFILSHSQNTEMISIAFYGGEPLLRMPLLKEAMEYIEEVNPGREIYFTLTTNGTLLTDENIEYFIKKNIHILISLDGVKEYHDANRVFHNGKGTFDIIMQKLSHIKKTYPDFYTNIQINSVINTNNSLSCSNEFFNAEDALEGLSVTMNTVSEFNAKTSIAYSEDFKVTNDYEVCKANLNMIGKISDSYVSKLYEQHRGYAMILYKTLRPFRLRGEEMHPSGPCLPGVARLFLDVDGNFYPCERVSEESKIMRIGNVESGIDVEKAKYLLNVGKVTEQECINCFASNFCKVCAVWIDGNSELSREKKLRHCSRMRDTAVDGMKFITILKEFGYKFEDSIY